MPAECQGAAIFQDLAATAVTHTLDAVPLTHKLEELVADLAVIPDAHERMMHVVERAKRIPPLPPTDRIEANRVRGCVSVVWLLGEHRDGRCYFRADAESPVVRGLVIFLCEFFSGFPPETIATSDVEPLDALDLTRNLSPTRRNGLAAARNAIRNFARQHAPAKP